MGFTVSFHSLTVNLNRKVGFDSLGGKQVFSFLVIHSLLTLHMVDHKNTHDINERIKDKHGMMVKD